jgi:predicted RNase H-like nuclease (RuvC/YqgF family)
MALLNDTSSQRTMRNDNSKKRRASSVPSSLPDLELLNTIESLKAELAELKASGEASRQEIATLKDQLASAEAKAAATLPVQTVTKTDDQPVRKSFFGV